MRYKSFTIENYRAIESPIQINLREQSLIPLIGVNECGKTTILQAIFAFDSVNDKDYGGRHLENTINLYHTTDKDPLISAEIEIAYSRLTPLWDMVVNRPDTAEKKSSATAISAAAPSTETDKFPLLQKDYTGSVSVTRNLNTKEYSIAQFSNVSPELQHNLATVLIRYMPYILYNDDFQDRPPSKVEIPSEKPKQLSDWLAIYERLFTETDPTYSLFTTAQLDDTRRKGSILSDVQNTLNNTLTKAWRAFLLDRAKQIAVRLEVTNNELQIKIVENIGQKERFFEVVDRSKGFLWFYNFVMKLEFNPKISGNRKDTIYLLDEPGSYLHAAAQKKLCAKLKAISSKHGNVIFCTHSHHLLDPEQIPINSIMIVGKSATKKIFLTRLPQYSTSREKVTALQPVFEALQISADEFNQDDLPILAVEGIYDRYAIKMFLPQANKLRILAGTSADSILKNIQILNAFRRVYVAIWDNDSEGRMVKRRAESAFGSHEAVRFDILPSRGGDKDRTMEQMFDSSDLDILRADLALAADANYESIIGGLYYAGSRRPKLIDKVGPTTKRNFEILQSIVDKRLKLSRNLRENDD
jgi:energy-coupling factor transporter ATP-binding protein EcfA2